MNMDQKQYGEYVKGMSGKSPLLKDMAMAFLFGGTICVAGQTISGFWLARGLEKVQAGTATSVTLIFIGALLTGLSVYDNLAKYGGAGTLIPITGFANSMVSQAMEFRAEGLIMGVAAKMFVIAGPVLVYGVTASVVYGVVLYIAKLI